MQRFQRHVCFHHQPCIPQTCSNLARRKSAPGLALRHGAPKYCLGGGRPGKPAAFKGRIHAQLPTDRPPSTTTLVPKHRPRLAVFVSGGGSNFKKIHEAILDLSINADIAVVVSDMPLCGACKHAAESRIPIVMYPASHARAEASIEHNADTPEALRDLLLTTYGVDYVILAGFLKLVPQEVVAAFSRKMLNIHPGFLPTFGGKGFYGSRVHKAVIASGVRFTGPTVHFVDESYDTGPIVAQRAIPVSPLEDYKQLAARVLREEHILYPEVVAALVDGRISWREDGIPILWKAQ